MVAVEPRIVIQSVSGCYQRLQTLFNTTMLSDMNARTEYDADLQCQNLADGR